MKLVARHFLSVKVERKGTKYVISPAWEVIQPISIDKYYEREIDERDIKAGFNFSVINDVLAAYGVFTESELQQLTKLQRYFKFQTYFY